MLRLKKLAQYEELLRVFYLPYSELKDSVFQLELTYSVSLRIQSESGKIQTKITPNTDTFYAVTGKTFKRLFSIFYEEIFVVLES